MQNNEEQLNELLAQSDRVSAELKRELYLIERADAAINYLRAAREQTAVEIAQLLDNRGTHDMTPVHTQLNGSRQARQAAADVAFGSYDPCWPQPPEDA